MLIATRRVRKQLAEDPTVVRWASLIAGPNEFWTITVWRSRHDMQQFMRSGAHDEIMWLFAKLLRSFWLMRWRPAEHEVGHWRGLRLSGEPAPALVINGVRQEGLDEALAHLPWLAAAVGPDGRAAYEHSAWAKRRKAEVGEAGGMVMNLRLPRWRPLRAFLQLRRLRAAAVQQGAVRVAVGIGHIGEAYLLGLWPETGGVTAFVQSPAVTAAADRWGQRFWLSTWSPENEFGHWDGLRVRRRRRPVIAMPAEAARLGG